MLTGGDPLGCPRCPDLGRVEGGATRTRHSMGSSGLSHREQPSNGGSPPQVNVYPAIVVLGAHLDLKAIGGQINARIAVEVELVCRLVHVPQALDRRLQAENTYRLQVSASLAVEQIRIPARLIDAEVEEDPTPSHHRLAVGENVDEARALMDLVDVEGPLVALAEDKAGERARIVYNLGQKVVLGAVGVHRDERRHHLHVGPRDIPARPQGGHSELELRQVVANGTCAQGGTGRTPLTVGPHRVSEHSGRSTGGQDDIACGNED